MRHAQDGRQIRLMSDVRRQHTVVIVPAVKDVFYHLVSGKCILLAHYAQGGKAPVHTVEAKVLSQMVGEVFFLGKKDTWNLTWSKF